MALLKNVGDIYIKPQHNIDQFKLQAYLGKVQEKYSEHLSNIISCLLEYEEEAR